MTKSFDERYFNSSDGLRLYFRDYAQAPSTDRAPILCLPGLTRNSRDFDPLAKRLAGDRRVISPDLRGRGMSEYDGHWSNYHPAQYVADIWLLFGLLEISQVVVIGTSLGGWLAMSMASERPEAITASVINDIGPDVHAAGLARVKAAAGNLDKVEDFAQAVVQTRSCYEVAFPDWTADQWSWYTETTYQRTSDGQYDLNYDRNIGHAVRQGVSDLRQDPWHLFDGLLKIPTLLLRGELSDILTEEIALKMRQRKPDLHIATVPNRGHAPLLDEPEAINAISRFMAEI